eukprot:m.88388 g.88388  ORF g.88388 m.88388 type:complete len:258 (-) comp15183_c1_seq1:1419-2192(-)
MDMNLGKHCALPDCRQLDFLPYKCDACGKITCHEHRQYAAHGCTESYRKDVIVPSCPKCGVVVESRPGEDPNIAMNEHIENGCVSPRSGRKIYPNSCHAKGCKAREAMQLICSECHLNHCLRHRFPTDHQCNPKAAAEAAAKAAQIRTAAAKAAKASSASTSKSSSLSAPKPVSLAQSGKQLDEERARRKAQMAADEALARSLQAGGAAPPARGAAMGTAASASAAETEEEQLQRAIAESLKTQQQSENKESGCAVS